MSNGRKNSRSLRFNLLALSLGITVMLGAASFGILRYIVATQTAEQLGGFEGYARGLSDSIAAQFFERYGDVQAFAINPDLRSPQRNTIVQALNAYAAMYHIYDLIMVVGRDGRLIAVNDRAPDGKALNIETLYAHNFSKEEWFQSTLRGEFTTDKEKGFQGTFVEDIHADPWVSSVYGKKSLGSSFSAPIRDAQGQVVSVVSNRAGSRWFEVAFKETSQNMRKMGLSEAELVLVSKTGDSMFYYKPVGASMDATPPAEYDWDVLLKYNYRKAKSAAAEELAAQRAGALIEDHPVTHEPHIVGFSTVRGAKFIESLGWGVLVWDDYEEALAAILRAQRIFYLAFALIISAASLVAYFYSNSLARTLTGLATRLAQGSTEVTHAADSISQSSRELSEAAVEQAAAIQETAASIDEVSSMVKKSSENALRSQDSSKTSQSAAEQGQQAVQDMIQAIQDISQSNGTIVNQVIEGNRQISEIVKVIAEIGNKTKVINDIVFQTKLLSFNASVEAARAGEHGKGFAVVAEEVGNLAQMSGNAAKDISAMLDSSIHKVESIVNDTKTKVETLVLESKSKVETGTTVAQRCGEALGRILTTVREVDAMVTEIASASREQSQGVSEINKAMNQLDQVTQQNTAVSQAAAASAEELSQQSGQLRNMVYELNSLVTGNQLDAIESSKKIDASHTPQTSAKARTALNNVVPLSDAKRRSTERATETEGHAEPRRKVVGGTSHGPSTPSKDDPRFEDV